MKITGISPWLFPLSLAYGAVVWVRNLLFDKKYFHSKVYPIPIICVGNLAVGGTGKTPMVEYLLRTMGDKYRMAVVSRGYKRKTRGMLVAQKGSTAEQIGDEPRQIKTNFPDVKVVVDGNRRRAIEYLLSLPEGQRPEVIVLDDGFQHRWVAPSFSILLTDWNAPFTEDKLLPAGRLREMPEARLRADCVIVTRCPKELSPIDLRIKERQLSLYPHQKLFFAQTHSGELTPLFPEEVGESKAFGKENKAFALAGIAHPEPYFREVGTRYTLVDTFHYADHHHFTHADLATFEELASKVPDAIFILTQKDAVRLEGKANKLNAALRKRIYYLPIETTFTEEQALLLGNIIGKSIRQVHREHQTYKPI